MPNDNLQPPGSGGSGLRILLVDDDPGSLEQISWTLRLAGSHVEVARDAQLALSKIAENRGPPFHFVLTDQCMPRMSGGELTRTLSKNGQRVILYSASPKELSFAVAADVGALAYVRDPYALVDLKRLLVAVSARSPTDKVSTSVTSTPKDPSIDDVLASAGATERDRQVFVCLREGLNKQEIAARLGIGARTVHHHIDTLHRLFKVHTTAALLGRVWRLVDAHRAHGRMGSPDVDNLEHGLISPD